MVIKGKINYANMNLMSSKGFSHNDRHLPMEEFLAIEDNDIQKYIFVTNGVHTQCGEVKIIDNDKKVAWYDITKKLKINTSGKFYIKSTISQWIVYDKLTKKSKVSANVEGLYLKFLSKYFTSPEIIAKFTNGNVSKTLVKKIIEGKIKSVGDLIGYHKSYTLKRKDINDEIILKAINHAYRGLLHCVEDPNNLKDEDIIKLGTIEGLISYGKLFKIKVEDLDKSKEKYDRWISEQSERYDSFKRYRAKKDGNNDGKEYVIEASDVSY